MHLTCHFTSIGGFEMRIALLSFAVSFIAFRMWRHTREKGAR